MMFSIKNISAIAKYERRIILRSWFFRIFAIISLLIIGIFGGVTIFERNPFIWAFKSMPNGLIYSNMFLLNIFQSIIAVFLATDFLKRDKKLNTAEVLFVRPMNNFEYVIGKTFGLFSVFILLNILVLILTAVYEIISKQLTFELLPLLYYFLLISIPTLVFIVGLSFALMLLVRNQPVSFIILLGYIALVLFYLGNKPGYIFDYMVYIMPLPYSDIVGFNSIGYELLHRLSYFLLGCSFIFFTVWGLNRIPNRVMSRWGMGLIAIVLLVASGFGFYKMVSHNNVIFKNREKYFELSKKHFNDPVADMQWASIHVEYGDELTASSEILLKNNSNQVLDTFLFSLNPELKVQSVKNNNNELKFIQDGILVKVVADKSLDLGAKCQIVIEYKGIPDFDIAYIDNDYEDVFGYDQIITLRINKEYGFYNDDYVLLTKECLWYPTPGVVYDPSRPAVFRQQFTHFDLEVVSKTGMLPVSQGQRTTKDSLIYNFIMRDPLPQISLSIANYKEESIDIDGLKVNLCYVEGHDFFKESLSELGDTLKPVILEFLDDYERPMDMYYPYPQFSLVEAPVQYASLSHSWTSTRAQSQPQLVYYPESGFNVRQADFNSNMHWIQRNNERNNQGLSEREIQATVFLNFLNNVFAEETENSGFGPGSESTAANPYSIFPNYYYYVNYITSDECPVLNYAFESYLQEGEDDPRSLFMSRMQGLGDGEKANLMLNGKSLKQIIAEVEDKEAVNRVLSAKGSYLLTWMEKQINSTDFEEFILDYLYDNSYKEIKYTNLIQSMSGKFDVEMGNFLSDWYNADKLPAFGVGDFSTIETIDGTQSVYVIKTKITNYTNVAGMVKFTFELEGSGGGPGFMGGTNQNESEERIYVIGGNQTKEIQIVLLSSPRAIIFNSLLSQNIPLSSMQFGVRAEKDETVKAVEYEKIVNSKVEYITEGELVVDNKDPGFSSYDPAMENPIRQFVESRKEKNEETEYVGMGFGNAPSTWSLSANSDYFGKVEHSAVIVRSGDGGKTATWEVQIPKEGYYDISVYLNRQRGGRRGGPPGRPGGGRSDPEGKYIYTIAHEDGTETIELEVKNFEDGWNLLGSFYYSEGSTTVSLSDAGGANSVIADAVKWVRQN